jgi:Skp family chaperone for outer membrane proteins
MNEVRILGVAAAVVLLMTGCAGPKTVVERHYHESGVDTVAVQAQVDRRLEGWRETVVREVGVAMASQQTERESSEQERERVTETVTTWVDSLGRQIRQEQRTTERDVSRQQQLREERMQRAWEERMQRVADSLNAAWTENFSRFEGHWAEADSTAAEVKPAEEDGRPWWKRWREAVKWVLVGAAAVFIAEFFSKKDD